MQKTDKTNYVFVAKMILTTLIAVAVVITAICEYYTIAIEGAVVAGIIWVMFTIQEIKIGLLQEINNKIKKEE